MALKAMCKYSTLLTHHLLYLSSQSGLAIPQPNAQVSWVHHFYPCQCVHSERWLDHLLNGYIAGIDNEMHAGVDESTRDM